MRFGLKETVIENIISVLIGCLSVEKAAIFGSRACGDYKHNSDIDLAVWTGVGVPPGLRSDLDEAAGIYKIDVVDMNGLKNESLRNRIEKQGIEIYKRGS